MRQSVNPAYPDTGTSGLLSAFFQDSPKNPMFSIKPKKSLGQHFLTDKNIAGKITGALSCKGYDQVIEIGPGMGVLTGFLLENKNFSTTLIEIDRESAEYLRNRFPDALDNIYEQDFLHYRLEQEHSSPLAIIGNFPYNISSQIFFKILDNRHLVTEVVCMLQKEVAERIVSPPGSKVYGILSVLIQAWYKTEYLFSVNPQVFTPPPNVMSAVIRITRRPVLELGCDEKLFFSVVKTAFNQRRKMLRNSLKSFLAGKTDMLTSGSEGELMKSPPKAEQPAGKDNIWRGNSDYPLSELLSKRPEQLSVEEFIRLTNHIEAS